MPRLNTATKEATNHIRERKEMGSEELIYCMFRVKKEMLIVVFDYCGCCEPYSHISTKVIRQERWSGCAKISDSMAMENINDTVRQQSICCCFASGCCCCCIDDFADIVIFGVDESNQNGSKSNELVLKNISNSMEVHDKISKHLKNINVQKQLDQAGNNPTDE